MVRSRTAAAVVSIALIVITLSPVARDPNDDGYPLSTYPMFAWRRPTTLTMSYPVGVTATGRHYLSPWIVGSAEVLQARAIVERSIAAGMPELRALCDRIAARVAQLDDYRDVTQIRIVTGTHDAVEFLVRDAVGREVERMRCEVRR